MDKYKKVLNELLEFRDERDWKQFHDSKNLAAQVIESKISSDMLKLRKKVI